MPAIQSSIRQPLCLASSQLVLLRHQSGTQFGAVETSGRKVVRMLAGGVVELAYDACVQEVLPWKSLTHGWEEAIRRDVDALQGMGERVRFQIEEVHPPYTVARLKHLSDSTRVIVEAASQSPSVARFARDAGKAVHDGLDAATKLLAATTEDVPQDETKPRELDGQVDKLMHTVRLALKGPEPEVLAASALPHLEALDFDITQWARCSWSGQTGRGVRRR